MAQLTPAPAFHNMNTTKSWHVFQQKISLLRDKYLPLKWHYGTSKRKNCWITKATIKETRKREKAWIHYKKTESRTQYKAYKSIRNRVTRLIRKDKEEYQKRLVRCFKDNPKRFYGYMRRMRTVKAAVSNIDLENGGQTDSDREAAEELCRYFGEVFVKEGSWNDDSDVKVGSVNLAVTLTEEVVLKAVNKLKCDKSPDTDSIHPKLLREAAAEVVKPLSEIYIRRQIT